ERLVNRGADFGQSEIENFGVTAFSDKYISRLDVPMDDALRVGRVERIGNFCSQIELHVHAERLAGNQMTQGDAVHEFHGDERQAGVVADFINCADVGVVEGGSGLCFALKTFEGFRIPGQLVRHKLQRDKTAQTGVFGFVNNTHATTPQAFDNAIVG